MRVITIPDFKKLELGIKHSFQAVRDELDQHLDSINGNTTEIQEVYQHISELDQKIMKLTERLDELQLVLNPSQNLDMDVQLSTREQEVFLVLYTSAEPANALEIAKRLGLTEEMAASYVWQLMGKGIPVKKYTKEGVFFFALDDTFKDVQARKNVVNIDEKISKDLLAEHILE